MRNLRALSYKKGLAGAPGRVGIWGLIWLQEGSQWETFPALSIQIFAIKIQLLEEDSGDGSSADIWLFYPNLQRISQKQN